MEMAERSYRSRVRAWLRRSALALAVLIALPILAVAVLVGRVWFGQPDLSGERHIMGLQAEATIGRTALGVVHIRAASERDAYTALGFVHAQDRFFQMEMLRRLAAGRLAEIIGPSAAGFDARLRTLGIDRRARDDVTHLPPDILAIYEAYADGVNAWLATRRGVAADELALVLAPEPEPWTPAHSIAWTRLMSMRLVGNWGSELMRLRLAKRLTPAQMADLWPEYPADGPITALEITEAALATARALAALANPDDGSNAWVVAAARSASGGALLANDPHLGLTTPGTWHLVRMEAPGFLLAGATAPGMPAVVLGHNGHVAWGLTNATTDTSDVFIETIDPSDPSRYLTPDGPMPFTTRTETIHVRFGEDQTITVRETRHGPVISDNNGSAPDGTALALAHTGLLARERAAVTIHRMNRAQSWGDILAALKFTNGPQQNVFYAGPDGIGMATGGLLPIRRDSDGYMPTDGASGAGDWVGFADVSAMPQVFQPNTGWLANANNRLVGDDYPLWLGREWGYAGRAERIFDLLHGAPSPSLDDMRAMQMDTVSPIALRLKPLMLDILAAAPNTDSLQPHIARLRQWNGDMTMDDHAPALFFGWLRNVTETIFADELGDDFQGWFSLRVEVLEHVLGNRPIWCDDGATRGVETCAWALKAALEKTVVDISAEITWGDLHQTEFRHMAFGRLPVIGDAFNLRINAPGGQETINRAAMRFNRPDDPFGQAHGPSLRAIYDVADLERSEFIIGPGQSGRLFSENRSSLMEMWRDGHYVTLSAHPDIVQTLTLKPRP